MELDIILIFVLVIAALGSGVMVGIGSGTAGAIMIPAITIFLGYSIHSAIGSSLIFDCIIGGVAGLVFIRKGKVNLRSALTLAAAGIIGAFIGSRYTSSVPESGLNLIIAFFLLILGLSFIVSGVRKNAEYLQSKFNFTFFKKNQVFSFILFGFIIGIISGFSGISGAGIIALGLIFILDYDIHTAIGTSLVMAFFITGSGATGHILNGEFIPPIVLIGGIGAAIGAFLGSFYANKINEDKLGRVIGVIVLILAIAIILKQLI